MPNLRSKMWKKNFQMKGQNRSRLVGLVKKSEDIETYRKSDLYKMHTYRDAILGTRGAYVLYPGRESARSVFVRQRSSAYRERYGVPSIGAFPLRPRGIEEQQDLITAFLRKTFHDLMNPAAEYQRAGAAGNHRVKRRHEKSAVFEYPSADKLRWFRRMISAWAKGNMREFPWRRTKDPYAIFVAEFLLQQTDAPRVVPVYHRMLETYPTLKTLAEASVFDLAHLLQPLGFHFRALRLSQAAQAIMEDPNHKGRVPHTETALLKLPGVGRYMARSVCANAFGQRMAVLDTNVVRILQRFFGIESRYARPRNDPFMWEVAQEAAPHTDVGAWNLALIDFGAATCKSRKPRCPECPLQQQCAYPNKTPA